MYIILIWELDGRVPCKSRTEYCSVWCCAVKLCSAFDSIIGSDFSHLLNHIYVSEECVAWILLEISWLYSILLKISVLAGFTILFELSCFYTVSLKIYVRKVLSRLVINISRTNNIFLFYPLKTEYSNSLELYG